MFTNVRPALGAMALGVSVLALGSCGSSGEDASKEETTPWNGEGRVPLTSNWDGKPKSEADQVVTLKLTAEPAAILLNGDPADVLLDRDAGTAQVLIPSDETGLSCENSYIVTFTDGSKGQLLANHCHDEPVFTISPGDMAEELVSKEDVDNSDEDSDAASDDDVARTTMGDVKELPLAFEWSANGYESLPSDFEWSSYSGEDTGFTLSVPETDNFVWTAECNSGVVANWIALAPPGIAMGDTGSLKLEVEGNPTREFTVRIGSLPFGDGGAGSVAPVVDIPKNAAIYSDMKAGQWLYIWMQVNGQEAKLRAPLTKAKSSLNAALGAC